MNKRSFIALYGVLGALGWLIAIGLIVKWEPVKEDKLSAQLTFNYVRSVVWYHSKGKLHELKAILSTSDMANRETVERKIENMLRHRTSAYIYELNMLDAPIPNVGQTYESLFDFDLFLQDIYDVTFSSNSDINGKISEITDIMEKYQSLANDALYNKMKHKES